MRIEERGYSMITDEQGIKWLLKKLYDDGWRYYAKDISGCVFLTKKEPAMIDDILDVMSGGLTKSVDTIAEIMPNIDRCGILDIAKELGIIDWSKVEVDTPVFVRDSINEVWKCRYFAEYKDGKVYTWRDGKTSWSNVISDRPVVWRCAELAFKE